VVEIKRFAFRAQSKKGMGEKAVLWFTNLLESIRELINREELMTLSLFKWKDNFFVYYETLDCEIIPDELFPGGEAYLQAWPGEDDKRYWIPMMDIYHCAEPVSKEHWRRKQPVEKTTAKVIKLKPEMVASYIFYHYQLQEEKPGDWSKYPVIFINENLLFFYLETPDAPEKQPYSGKLDTTNSPENWGELMSQHFAKWEEPQDYEIEWKAIEQIYMINL
jgi:hypothetical protein